MSKTLMKIGAVVVALVLSASCTDGPDAGEVVTPTSQAPATPAESIEDPYACTESCGANKEEVKTTPCHTPADDVVKPERPKASIAQGSLSLRKSSASGADCDRLYWARFEPDPANVQGFVVTLTVTDPNKKGQQGFSLEQRSEPQRPDLAAFTKGYKVKPGFRVSACITPLAPQSELRHCVSTDVV